MSISSGMNVVDMFDQKTSADPIGYFPSVFHALAHGIEDTADLAIGHFLGKTINSITGENLLPVASAEKLKQRDWDYAFYSGSALKDHPISMYGADFLGSLLSPVGLAVAGLAESIPIGIAVGGLAAGSKIASMLGYLNKAKSIRNTVRVLKGGGKVSNLLKIGETSLTGRILNKAAIGSISGAIAVSPYSLASLYLDHEKEEGLGWKDFILAEAFGAGIGGIAHGLWESRHLLSKSFRDSVNNLEKEQFLQDKRVDTDILSKVGLEQQRESTAEQFISGLIAAGKEKELINDLPETESIINLQLKKRMGYAVSAIRNLKDSLSSDRLQTSVINNLESKIKAWEKSGSDGIHPWGSEYNIPLTKFEDEPSLPLILSDNEVSQHLDAYMPDEDVIVTKNHDIPDSRASIYKDFFTNLIKKLDEGLSKYSKLTEKDFIDTEVSGIDQLKEELYNIVPPNYIKSLVDRILSDADLAIEEHKGSKTGINAEEIESQRNYNASPASNHYQPPDDDDIKGLAGFLPEDFKNIEDEKEPKDFTEATIDASTKKLEEIKNKIAEVSEGLPDEYQGALNDDIGQFNILLELDKGLNNFLGCLRESA